MQLEISRNKLMFIVGSVGFVFLSFFISMWLIVGAGLGAFGMYFVLMWYMPYRVQSKYAQIERKRKELAKLESEVKK